VGAKVKHGGVELQQRRKCADFLRIFPCCVRQRGHHDVCEPVTKGFSWLATHPMQLVLARIILHAIDPDKDPLVGRPASFEQG
jgi:hypothetical protein